MKAGMRGIILGGWANLNASMLKGHPDTEAMEAYVKENVLFLQTAPHEVLFPQCSVIVHHGGSGTTAAALRSGVPTIITPCAFDQFDNAQLVQNNGCGFAMPQFSKVTVEQLSKAMKTCVQDEKIIKKSQVMGEKLLKEDGLGQAVKVVDNFIINELDTG